MRVLLIYVLISKIFFLEVNAESYTAELAYIHSIRLDEAPKAKEHLDKLEKEYFNLTEIEKAKYLNLRAHSEAMLGNFNKSLEYSKKVPLVTSNYDSQAQAKSLEVRVLELTGKYQESFMGLYRLLDDLHKVDDVNLKQDILLNALSLHITTNIFDKAQELAQQSLALAKRYDNHFYECHALLQLTHINTELGQLSLAGGNVRHAKATCKNEKSKLIDYVILARESHIKQEKGDLDEALSGYLSIFNGITGFGWHVMMLDSQVHLSQILLDLKEYDKILQYALPAYDYSMKFSMHESIAEISKVLAGYYKQDKDLDKAYSFRDEYYKAMEELNTQLQEKRIAYYQAMSIRSRNMARDKRVEKKSKEATSQ